MAEAPPYTLHVEYDDPDARVVVARDRGTGEDVGLATAGVSRDPDPPAAWELYSVNVVGEAQGSGLADSLMAAALGDRPASLWVLVDNSRAQAFYRRHGFAADGRVREPEASGGPELRMVR